MPARSLTITRPSNAHPPVVSNTGDDALSDLLSEYKYRGKAIPVDFRKLVPIGAGTDRATHLMHSYPAKLLPNIPAFFLNSPQFAPVGSTVYDPFCGSGTTLVEALLSGHRPVGADANPLARMIAAAKTTAIGDDLLSKCFAAITFAASSAQPTAFSPVVRLEKWFDPLVARDIGKLHAAIQACCRGDILNFFLVCLSSIIKKCSLADPRMSVPVRSKSEWEALRAPVDVAEAFAKAVDQNRKRLGRLPPNLPACPIGTDARIDLTWLGGSAELADLVITSPPYAGAQKYIRASSLSLGWLGLAPGNKLRMLEQSNIGREHIAASERGADLPVDIRFLNPLLNKIQAVSAERRHIYAVYLTEMRTMATSVTKSLKSGGRMVLVMGDNRICGIDVQTSQYIKNMFELEGLRTTLELVDTIKSRGLMTKRNKTAGLISHEHVFVLHKD